MRLGLCCTPQEGPAALAAGYDYVEYPANAIVPSETTNLFFSGPVDVYGEEGLRQGKATIEAAALRGVQMMVLGSGAARRKPAHLSHEQAESAFVDLVAKLDDFASQWGIRIAPESLNPEETDVGTSLPLLARALRERGLEYTADSYHALVEAKTREGDMSFWREQIPFAPAHIHFAPFDRSIPMAEDAGLRSFFARLTELGYDGRASLECRRKAIPDPVPLRALFAG